jgi:transcriptional regulator with XRE-family HTH domain
VSLADRIGKRIKLERDRRGLSQHELAAKAAISRGYLARLETGRHDPTVGVVERLARALRVKVADLLK